MSAASRPCAHCGAPIPSELEGELFCCRGCATAHDWISKAGLNQFYQLRDEQDSGAPEGPRDQEAARNFAHFDDPDYLESLGMQAGDCEVRVIGMHCAACVWLLEQLPSRLPGLETLRVNWQNQTVHLRWDTQALRFSKIAELCDTLGYPLVADDRAAQDLAQKARRSELIRLAITGACAGNVMLVSLALYSGELSDMGAEFRQLFEAFAAIFAVPCVFYGAQPFYRAALASLRLGRLHLDVPIACGVLLGFGFGIVNLCKGQGDLYFDTIALLVFLLLIGRRLQDESRRWAYSQAGALNVLLPASTIVKRDGQWQELSRLQLQNDDLVRVDPGTQAPADGTCVQGESHVDTRSLTGESHPIPIRPGAPVLAGSTNLGETFTLRVTAREDASRLGRVARSLSGAQEQRTGIQRSIDKVSASFSWVVLSTAIAAGAYWVWTQSLQSGLDVFLAVLIISCPCALGLATPLALALAKARAARFGIVVAKDRALEDLATLPHIAFDKTGTLTTGEIRVVDTHSTLPEDQLRAQVATLEQKATHPIARSLQYWTHRSTIDPKITEIETIPGQGIRAFQGSKVLRLGRFRDPDFRSAMQRWHQRHGELSASSTIYLAHDNEIVAAIGLQDEARPGAGSWIQELQRQGRQVSMLSGDSPNAVQNIARELGIQNARSEMTPEDKLEALKAQPWVMVGDGINDAPALRCATVGIAVGQNAEIAAKVADLFVIRAGISNLRELFSLARKTRTTIHRNLTFALAYNLIFALAAVTGHIRPLIAAVIMPLSSLTVLASSWLSLRDRDSSVKH